MDKKENNREYLNGLLNLPEFNVLDLTENQDTGDYLFRVVLNNPTKVCPHCNSKSSVDFGKYHRFLRDMNLRGHKVGIFVEGSRHRCKLCRKTFVDRMFCADESGKTTLRLKKIIMEEALNKPFLQIEKELDIKATTVKRYFQEYVKAEEKNYVRYSPRVLGIDEAHLCKNMRGVIVDVEAHNIIELLKDRKVSTVSEYLSSLPNSDNIEVVTMDMWRPYKEAVNECIPHADIVIDRFHVIKEMLTLLNVYKNEVYAKKRPCSVRNIEAKYLLASNLDNLLDEQIVKLHSLFNVYPELELAYTIKENFRLIYQCNDLKEALEYYEDWKSTFPPELKTMTPIIKTVENWKSEIFNYFKHNYTNAITESLNNVIKCLVRAGRGYSFEVLRAKVLFGKAKVSPKYSYNKRNSLALFDPNNITSSFIDFSSRAQTLLRGSGASIEQLLTLLQDKNDLSSI